MTDAIHPTPADVARHLDEFLSVADVPDYPHALNGLQVEGTSAVRRVAAAVDASEASIEAAVAADCQLLLVHHGLFWDGNRPVTGRRYRRLRRLIESDVALYSAHLPLDVHDEVGNNAVLAGKLGLTLEGRFGRYEGLEVGLHGRLDAERGELKARLESLLGGPVQLIAGGPERIRRLGVLTGGGGSMIGAAAAAGLDALVTGEGSHHTYFDAVEGGINVFYGGHYATETWGVRALADHLERRFGVESVFLDLPTGL